MALRGLPQAHDGAQGRGLAGTVAAEQHGELAARHGEIHAMQDMVTAAMGMHALEAQQRVGPGAASSFLGITPRSASRTPGQRRTKETRGGKECVSKDRI